MSVINLLYLGNPLTSSFSNSEDPGEMRAQCMNMSPPPPPPPTLKRYWSWKLITFVNEIHNPNKKSNKGEVKSPLDLDTKQPPTGVLTAKL